MLRCIAVAHSYAAHVVALPTPQLRLGIRHLQTLIVLLARAHPGLVSRFELRILRNGVDLGAEALELAAPHWGNHRDRLALLEHDRMIAAGNLPVHREGGFAPIGFNNA